ncbi:pentapeptide repeat-containing protein [Nocardia sp. NPDC058705]|uniref:pentapeptide repeat-containing protein n=1 Tax=Nocardia sp. NPDC058705 TaxID=3346609 RepID=UPI00367DDE06
MSNRPLSSRPTELGADLRSADLHGADLRDANLRDANLASRFPLSPAEQRRASYHDKLRELAMYAVVLAGAAAFALGLLDLADPFPVYASLLGGILAGNYALSHLGDTMSIRMNHIALQVMKQQGKATFPGANLTESDLTGADLAGANLTHVNLDRADLRTANLKGANLTNANLRGADLTDADLTGADLSGANLADTTLPRISALHQVRWSTATDWAENNEAVTARSVETEGGHYVLNPGERSGANIATRRL